MRDDLTVMAMLWGCGYAGALLVMQLFMVVLAAGAEAVDAGNILAATFGILLLGLALVAFLRREPKDAGKEPA